MAGKEIGKRGAAEWILLVFASIPALIIGLAIAVAVALIMIFGKPGFMGRPGLSGDPFASGGCYFPDTAFTAVKTTSADDVLKKLSKYNNLQGKKAQVQKIIDKANQNGLNYYIFLDMWSGEQSFGNDDAAFGCGVYDGKNRAPGFDNQLDCATDVMLDAINNRGNYTEPTGKDIFTRFFYNYVGGMQENYRKFGYVAGADNPRVIIHKILAPEEVVCASEGSGPGLALIGAKLYPPLGDKMGSYLTYFGHSTWCCGHCTLCAVDYSATGGTPIYAVNDGTVSNLHPYTSKGGQYRGYTFFFNSSDGQIYATYAHLNPAGRLSTNDIRPKTTVIKKGDLVGVIYPGLNHPHLHFELKINGQTVGMTGIGGTNNQLQYFGKL